MQDQTIPATHVLYTLQKAKLIPTPFRDCLKSDLTHTNRVSLSATSFFERTKDSVRLHHETKNATWEVITTPVTPEQDVTSFVDFALATRHNLRIAEEVRKLPW